VCNGEVLLALVSAQEHVGEYGVHWNFFFTLAGVALLTSLISIPPSWYGPLGIMILAGKVITIGSWIFERWSETCQPPLKSCISLSDHPV
jgi:hypothetical protein